MNNRCFKDFIKYASLNVLGMMGLSCYILADTYFISKGLGAKGLTALNLAIPVYSVIHGSGLMLGMGGATRYAITKGQKQREAGNQVFTHTILSAAVLSVLFVLLGVFFSKDLAKTLGADAEVLHMTTTYLRVLLFFAPAFLFNDSLICFVRNDGDPKLAMTAMLGGSFLNIILDYIFIFPMKMGMFGAVFATGIAPVFSMILLSGHWLRRKNNFHLQKGAFQLRIAGTIVSLGFPSLITEVSSGIVIVVFNTILLRLQGNVGVAAYGVIANLSLVVVAIFTGIAQGIQPLISEAYGHSDRDRVKDVLRYAMISTVVLSGIIYLLTFLYADPITSVFNSERNRQMQEIAVFGLKVYFTAVPAVGFNIVLSVYFTSTANPLPAHLISLLRGLIIIVPMAFLLSAVCGITGVWLTFPVTEVLVAVFGIIMYQKSR